MKQKETNIKNHANKLEFLKEIPHGQYKTYFSPNINDDILKNALNFLIKPAEKTKKIYKKEILAVCVIDINLKGFHSLIFAENELYVKLDGFYNCILYPNIKDIYLENHEENTCLCIQEQTEKKTIICEYFNTEEFRDFLSNFIDFVKKTEAEKLITQFENKNLYVEKTNLEIVTAYLQDYKDEFNNDILMKSYLLKDKKYFNYLIQNLPRKYSWKNTFDWSFLCLATMNNDEELIEKFFEYNDFNLLPIQLKNEVESAKKSLRISEKINNGVNIAGGILGGMFHLLLGTSKTREEEIAEMEYKENQLEERTNTYNSKIHNIKSKFIHEFSKENIKIQIKKIKEKEIDIENKIKEANETIPTEIEKLKKLKLGSLLLPKGEFEKTDDYNKRVEKANKFSKNFEKEYADEILAIRLKQTQIDEYIKHLNEDLAFEKNKRKFLLKALNGDQGNISILEKSIPNKSKEFSKFYVEKSKTINFIIDKYDADSETFKINNYKVHIPIDIAPIFKQNFSKKLIGSEIYFENNEIIEKLYVNFNNTKYYLKNSD